jgi:plasmid stabilization system protein ParE
MGLVIRWTKKARKRYYEILEYIQDYWGMDKAIEFIDKTDDVLDNISEYPKMYPVSEKDKKLRKAVITKQSSVIYKINKDDAELIAFRDNREGK